MQRIAVMTVIALVPLNLPVLVLGQTTLVIRGGMSRATLDGQDELEQKGRTGLILGASANIPVRDRLGLRLDAGYVQKGTESEGDSELAGLGFNLDYLELSGLGVVKLGSPGSQASLYVLAGPSMAYLTNCEVWAEGRDWEGDRFSASASCDEESTKSIDLGVTGGVGVEVPISQQMRLSIDLQYTAGLLTSSRTRTTNSWTTNSGTEPLPFRSASAFP